MIWPAPNWPRHKVFVSMVNDVCLKTVNWWGKANMHPAARTRRIIGADELLFLLLWSSGYIESKVGLPLSGTFTLLFFRYVIAPYLLAERNHLYQWLGVLAGFVGVAVFVWGDAKFSGTPLVIFLDAAFDPNTQCGEGIIFAIFCAAR